MAAGAWDDASQDDVFLAKTVKEIKSKPICCLACKFEVFSADMVLFGNTATKDKRLIYDVQS